MEKAKTDKMLCAVRIRGVINITTEVKDTLTFLNLHKKNFCSVYKDNKDVRGMLKKVKDYITWGDITSEVFEELKKKRGEKDPKDPKKLKKFFRLNNPIGGFERKGVKQTFKNGGVLGNRKDKMGDLILKMLH